MLSLRHQTAMVLSQLASLSVGQMLTRSESKFPRPYLIRQFNRNTSGVDRKDQNIAAYRKSIPSHKWWWPLFAYLLDVAMQNACLIYGLSAAAKLRPAINWISGTTPTSPSIVRNNHRMTVRFVVSNSWRPHHLLSFGLMANTTTLRLFLLNDVVPLVDSKFESNVQSAMSVFTSTVLWPFIVQISIKLL